MHYKNLVLVLMLIFTTFLSGATVNGITYKIKQVQYTYKGQTKKQNASGACPLGIENIDNTPVSIKKVTLQNGTVLDNFAINNISVRLHSSYLSLPYFEDNIENSKKGVIFQGNRISATNKHATQALNTTNIKDYITNDDETHERLMMDLKYNGYYITGSDYILYHERFGNNAFKVQALNANGTPTGNIVVLPKTKTKINGTEETIGWNPGFGIGGPVGNYQPPWMGVIKASQFGVAKIYGLRVWATGADLKFYAAGTEPFNPPPIMSIPPLVQDKEGDSGTKDFKFTVSLDHASNKNVTFKYQTVHSSATAGEDYVHIPLTSATIPAGQTAKVITVKVKGDTKVEADETFYLKISSRTNVKNTSGTLQGMGKIINDDNLKEFECNNEGIIFAGNSTYSTNSSTIVNTLDLETKVFQSDLKTTNRHINAIGYNVQDNLVYGIGFRTPNDDKAQLVQVDADYKMTYYDIPNLKQKDALYALGDVDFNNTFYIATIRDENRVSTYLTELTLIDLETKTIKKTIPLIFPTTMAQKRIISADFAFNPIDEKLYTVNSETNELCQIDPKTGVVKELGDVGAIDGGSYSVISFFDLSGKFIFVNESATKLYMIDISDPDNINTTASVYKSNLNLPTSGDGAKCAYSKLPEEPAILGTFNIERTNSKNQPINTKERNAWYTQIVGRDFDYSLVCYKKDLSAEQNITNVTLNVELVNMDTNKTLYEYKFHVPDNITTSRIDISKDISEQFGVDLKDIEATKNARFRVSYAINNDGAILKQDCMQGGDECNNLKTDYAKDNFAIRPESFYVTIADKDKERINSRTPDAELKMAAGYDYNLSIIATQHNSIIASKGYSKSFNSSFPFNEEKLNQWNDNSSINEQIHFTNGVYSNTEFHHDNVGYYTLDIPSDENWTKVDQESGDCIAQDATTSTTANEKSGCIIKQQTLPITLAYYPDHFEVDVALLNLPSSGHDDFIYMNNLNTDNSVAIAFQGTISAKSENNVTTNNFIVGGMATDLLLDLIASQVSVEGTNQNIHATDGTSINFSRVVRFNNAEEFADIEPLPRISNSINIPNTTFLKENNGTMSLEMRYNLNKHLTAPVNPIQVTFERLNASSIPASSVSHEKLDPMYVPTGTTTFPNNIKQFYYAKVVSDKQRYPRVNINLNQTIVTPLNVDIYCEAPTAYCNERKIHLNGSGSGTTRDQNGWFISTKHNGELDGNVTGLIENNGIVTINPNDSIANTTLPNGHNPSVSATFTTTTCSPDNTTITIQTSSALDVDPASTYQVSCTKNNPSTWTGTGETGHTINSSPNIDKSNRMSW